MKKILILLSNGFEVLEAAAFIDILGWANVFGNEPVEIVTAGAHRILNCTFGFQAIPDAQITDVNLDDFDALAIPGGFEKAGFYEDGFSEEFLNVIRDFNKKKKMIASICVGALLLGKSGILKDRPATTYHLLEGKRRKQLAEMGANIKDKPVVKDRNIITSTSPATAIEVAFTLLEILTTKENVEKIQEMMGFESKNRKP
ncbi:DJ-1/PfpI family protein [bacterium]|nr:DJ-1/PfpI family protein [bacterium]